MMKILDARVTFISMLMQNEISWLILHIFEIINKSYYVYLLSNSKCRLYTLKSFSQLALAQMLCVRCMGVDSKASAQDISNIWHGVLKGYTQ